MPRALACGVLFRMWPRTSVRPCRGAASSSHVSRRARSRCVCGGSGWCAACVTHSRSPSCRNRIRLCGALRWATKVAAWHPSQSLAHLCSRLSTGASPGPGKGAPLALHCTTLSCSGDGQLLSACAHAAGVPKQRRSASAASTAVRPASSYRSLEISRSHKRSAASPPSADLEVVPVCGALAAYRAAFCARSAAFSRLSS